jgi:hypothetical protein
MLRSLALAFVIKEFEEILPPTLFFAAGFNLIVLTTRLVLDNFLFRIANFALATAGALVVGKAVTLYTISPEVMTTYTDRLERGVP